MNHRTEQSIDDVVNHDRFRSLDTVRSARDGSFCMFRLKLANPSRTVLRPTLAETMEAASVWITRDARGSS